jgi:carbon-monoxide dehydrogenase medium subunit
MYPASFRYYRPATLQEALSILQQEPEARPLAGGQSLIPAMKLRLMAPAALVDLGRLQDLRGMSREGGWWRIGAMTTHREIEFSGPPLLAEVAHVIADPAVRNRGTIGGSLAHADPAADYPAAILALEATIRAVGANGERAIPAHEFFQGMFTTSLMPGELITGIEVRELGPGWGWAYEKFPHPASGYAVVGVAAVVQVEGGVARQVRVGITGAADAPFRATAVEEALQGKVVTSQTVTAAVEGAFSPDRMGEDPFASARYRAHLCAVLARRAILRAWERASR